jgi:hypothetical protein
MPQEHNSWGGGVHYAARGEYIGQYKEHKPHGYGTMKYNKNSNEYKAGRERYAGQWFNGDPHGYGTMLYQNGATYVGGWKNDKRDGNAVIKYYSKNWITFIGTYKSDFKEKGTLAGGTKDYTLQYVGKFRNGRFHDPDGDGASVTVNKFTTRRRYKDGKWTNNSRNENDILDLLK